MNRSPKTKWLPYKCCNGFKTRSTILFFQAAYSASGPILHLFWMSILLASFFLILSTFLERYSVVFRSLTEQPHYQIESEGPFISQREPHRVCSHPGHDHDYPVGCGRDHRCEGHSRGLHRAVDTPDLLQHPRVSLPPRLRPRGGRHPHHAPHLCHGVDPGVRPQHQHLWVFTQDFPPACLQKDSVSLKRNKEFVNISLQKRFEVLLPGAPLYNLVMDLPPCRTERTRICRG